MTQSKPDQMLDALTLVERLTGFTPGPWTLEVEQDEWPDHAIIGGNGDPVLWWDFDFGFRVSNADAAIIAAAPDLHRHITAALDRAEKAEAACKEWADISQANYQRAKKAEAEVERLWAERQQARNDALREAARIAQSPNLPIFRDGWTTEQDAAAIHAMVKVSEAIFARIDAPAPDPVQQAAKVLLAAMAHTDKRGTHAAAREFPQMGFINAGAVIGAALRALAGESAR